MTKSEKAHEEYQDIEHLLKSEEWAHFVVYLKKQAKGFQIKVNQCVDAGDIVGAKIAKALMNDRIRMINGFVKQHNQAQGGQGGQK